MTPALAYFAVADLAEGFHDQLARKNGYPAHGYDVIACRPAGSTPFSSTVSSDGSRLQRNRVKTQFRGVVGFKDVPVPFLLGDQPDYFSDVPERLVNRPPLAVTAFKERALDHIEAILILLDENGHLRILPFGLCPHT
jgi:hypothetical protein